MLNSVDDVIEALGGTAAAAALLGVGSPAVSNWRLRGKVPQEYFLLVGGALKGLGKEADPAVFGFKVLEART